MDNVHWRLLESCLLFCMICRIKVCMSWAAHLRLQIRFYILCGSCLGFRNFFFIKYLWGSRLRVRKDKFRASLWTEHPNHMYTINATLTLNSQIHYFNNNAHGWHRRCKIVQCVSNKNMTIFITINKSYFSNKQKTMTFYCHR